MDAATLASVVASGAAVASAIAAGCSLRIALQQARATFNSILYDRQIELSAQYFDAVKQILRTANRAHATRVIPQLRDKDVEAMDAYIAADTAARLMQEKWSLIAPPQYEKAIDDIAAAQAELFGFVLGLDPDDRRTGPTFRELETAFQTKIQAFGEGIARQIREGRLWNCGMSDRDFPISTFRLTQQRQASVVLRANDDFPARVVVLVGSLTGAQHFLAFPVGRIPELIEGLASAHQQAIARGLVKEVENA
jgi:hypothetical protein